MLSNRALAWILAPLLVPWMAHAQNPSQPSSPDAKTATAASAVSPTDGKFVREHWAQFGIEHANPMDNRRFRVNAPEVVLHPEFGSRSELKSSGSLQVQMAEDPRLLAGAELYLELWGGHPGTANRRVTINGRSTYQIADHGGQEHCTYQYPLIALKRTDIVNGYNALQFACDQGKSFWGHFIVDNACLRAILADDHPDLKMHGLENFEARVEVTAAGDERLRLALVFPAEQLDKIAAVEFHGFYTGYDENGNELTRDWHGFTKSRQASGHLGSRTESPFEVNWDTSMLPDQAEVAVRAVVRLKAQPKLCYCTLPVAGIKLPRNGNRVALYSAREMPAPFWSRAARRKTCTIPLDIDPAQIERAELHVVVWDGGAGSVKDYFTLNGQPIVVAGSGKHDLIYTVSRIDPKSLRQGDNPIELLSDTEHHGIEVCLPGPALVVRKKSPADRAAAPEKSRSYEQHALTHAGNPIRGKDLFADEKLTKCSICHKVGGAGGEAGPDLTHIGGKFGRPHLIESLLEPSQQIVEGFRTVLVDLVDGQVLTGIVKPEADGKLLLIGVDGAQRIIATSLISQRRDSPLSLMPQNLADELTVEQFTDLVAYLETLRAGGKPTPGSTITGPVTLPTGFSVRTVATGLTGATALEVLPDGRVLVCEQTGTLRMVKEGKLLNEPVLSLSVDSTWERGLIGVTFDPAFAEKPYLYACYVAKEPYPHHVVSRFTLAGDKADPASEQMLLVGDDQRKLGGKVPAGHQGGALHFDADGKLYIAIGEQTAETPSQRFDTLQGKILRIDADGNIPFDNPFQNQASGKYRAIWALGLRNPFTFAVHPRTGQLWINDVGGKQEEINIGLPAANFGWPTVEHGPTQDERFQGPAFHYPQASIAGGDFCPRNSSWPKEWQGRYFFADFVHGWIKTLDADAPRAATQFASGLSRPVDLRFSRDGKLYVLLRNAWVIDGKFEPGTSALLEIACPAADRPLVGK